MSVVGAQGGSPGRGAGAEESPSSAPSFLHRNPSALGAGGDALVLLGGILRNRSSCCFGEGRAGGPILVWQGRRCESRGLRFWDRTERGESSENPRAQRGRGGAGSSAGLRPGLGAAPRPAGRTAARSRCLSAAPGSPCFPGTLLHAALHLPASPLAFDPGAGIPSADAHVLGQLLLSAWERGGPG